MSQKLKGFGTAGVAPRSAPAAGSFGGPVVRAAPETHS